VWDNPRQLNAIALTLAVAASTAIAWAAVAWAVRQPIFAFHHVVFDGALVRVNPSHLQAVVQEELKGTFFTMRLTDARNAFARVPWVRRIALRRQWPDRLEVTVIEHQPFARWNDNALVNPQGEVFTASYDGELPQLSGPDGTAGDMAARFAEFGEALATIKLSIAEMRLSPRGAWWMKTAGESPLTIELGRAEAGERLSRFIAYYARTVGAIVRAGTRIDYVDLRYSNGFAARVPGFKETAPKKAT
jgi:cell division protein FtsQ